MSVRGAASALALLALVACSAGGAGSGGAAGRHGDGAAAPEPAVSAARAGGPASVASAPAAERLHLQVVARYPHDPAAFTQGLLWHDGKLYESTGLYGRSSVRRVDLATGKVEAEQMLPSALFGEGLALVGDRLVQLTWREGEALVWDRATLRQVAQHTYAGEGWGLTTAGARLLQSDGTARLTWRDPATFAPTGTLDVTEQGRPVPLLNELEAVGGVVWANLWTTDAIVRIDLASGRVTGRVDASSLHEEIATRGGTPDVLNGIAWRPETQTFLLTGKQWPLLFEVRLVPE